MKILLFLNCDIHAATALKLLEPYLQKHAVKIVLSKSVGNVASLAPELVEMKRYEEVGANDLISELAKTLSGEVVSFSNVNSPNALDDFKKFAPDLAISIRYGQIFKPPLISIPRLGILNLHSGFYQITAEF